LAVLTLLGASAALASCVLTRGLGIPGHNIVRIVFPMALGLALVPRRGAASLMGASGLATAATLRLLGVQAFGSGALTSLALSGVMIDLSLAGAQRGWSIYLRLGLAGLAANMTAFLVHGGEKVILGKPLAPWWQLAIITYPACGLLAGFLSAAVWFRVRPRGGPHRGDRGQR
jgi:hypothetical protein